MRAPLLIDGPPFAASADELGQFLQTNRAAACFDRARLHLKSVSRECLAHVAALCANFSRLELQLVPLASDRAALADLCRNLTSFADIQLDIVFPAALRASQELELFCDVLLSPLTNISCIRFPRFEVPPLQSPYHLAWQRDMVCRILSCCPAHILTTLDFPSLDPGSWTRVSELIFPRFRRLCNLSVSINLLHHTKPGVADECSRLFSALSTATTTEPRHFDSLSFTFESTAPAPVLLSLAASLHSRSFTVSSLGVSGPPKMGLGAAAVLSQFFKSTLSDIASLSSLYLHFPGARRDHVVQFRDVSISPSLVSLTISSLHSDELHELLNALVNNHTLADLEVRLAPDLSPDPDTGISPRPRCDFSPHSIAGNCGLRWLTIMGSAYADQYLDAMQLNSTLTSVVLGRQCVTDQDMWDALVRLLDSDNRTLRQLDVGAAFIVLRDKPLPFPASSFSNWTLRKCSVAALEPLVARNARAAKTARSRVAAFIHATSPSQTLGSTRDILAWDFLLRGAMLALVRHCI